MAENLGGFLAVLIVTEEHRVTIGDRRQHALDLLSRSAAGVDHMHIAVRRDRMETGEQLGKFLEPFAPADTFVDMALVGSVIVGRVFETRLLVELEPESRRLLLVYLRGDPDFFGPVLPPTDTK